MSWMIALWITPAVVLAMIETWMVMREKAYVAEIMREHAMNCVVGNQCPLGEDYFHRLGERLGWKIMCLGSRNAFLVGNFVAIAIWDLNWPVRLPKFLLKG